MEGNTQRVIQKPPLPTKTKIAAWWMIIIGITGITLSAYLSYVVSTRGTYMLALAYAFIIITFMYGLPFLFCGFILNLRKKWTWWLVLILLSVGLTSHLFFISLFQGSLYQGIKVSFTWSFLLFILPLILLLLDRKNFFKIAS